MTTNKPKGSERGARAEDLHALSGYVPGGTRVLNTEDGEPGTVMNGYAKEGNNWTEYEVETRDGIEIWRRDQFVLMAEIEAAAEEGGAA